MGTPARSSILSNLSTTLASITTGNGYNVTVVTVEPVGKAWAGVPQGLKPWIGYVPLAEQLEYLPGDQIRCVLPIQIIVHISEATQPARQTKLNNLLDDIIAALNVDTTRGSNAISTTVLSVDTDEGSPDAMHEGTMILSTEVAYMRTSGQS
tara:strand:+ start:26155 stop:26610 length:456 start_codon:yes stop_codon:yes gene_type:complete